MEANHTLTVGQALTLTTTFLARKGSPSPRLDAQILTAHVLGVRRLDLYLAPERPLTDDEKNLLRELSVRRGRMEPVAYITGHREFFGNGFHIDRSVLVPRPETESIVDAAIEFLVTTAHKRGRDDLQAADIGTGSGVIACSIATRLTAVRFTACDISPAALKIAGRNADALGVSKRVELIESDLFEKVALDRIFDLVVSNPPYIAETETGLMDDAARLWEPEQALFSGSEGTDVTFRLIDQTISRLAPDGALIVETGTPVQRAKVMNKMSCLFETVSEVVDPGGNITGLRADRPVAGT